MLGFILYIILAVWGVVFAVLYTEYKVALFVGVIILVPFFQYMISVLSCLLLKVEVEKEKRQVHQGETFDVKIQIQNKSPFPVLNGTVHYSLGYVWEGAGRTAGLVKNRRGKISFSVGARGKTECTLQVNGEYCGCIHIKICRVHVKEPFRVFLFVKKLHQKVSQQIYPRLKTVNVETEKSISYYNDEYDEFYEDHPGNDPSEIFEVRDYREGDKLQRIHWKLSSKRDHYMVKEFSDPVVIDAIVICDNIWEGEGIEGLRGFSRILESTAQVSYSLLMNKIFHYVFWFDGETGMGKMIEVRDAESFALCMHQLMQCAPSQEGEKFANYLLHVQNIKEYTNVFFIGKANKERLEENGIRVRVVE